MFVRYFCDYQHKTLGECLYRQYLNPLVCFEVLIPLCMYSLLGAAFVVNHLALSEKDSLCGPGGISLQESSPVRGVWETRPGPAFSVLYSPCYPRKTCTFKCKAHSTLGFIPKKPYHHPCGLQERYHVVSNTLEKNLHNRNQVQKQTNYSNVLWPHDRLEKPREDLNKPLA